MIHAKVQIVDSIVIRTASMRSVIILDVAHIHNNASSTALLLQDLGVCSLNIWDPGPECNTTSRQRNQIHKNHIKPKHSI